MTSKLIKTGLSLYFVSFFVQPRVIEGRSMQPTLNPNKEKQSDIVIMDTLTPFLLQYGWQIPFDRNAIVICDHPHENVEICKRITHIEGDVVRLSDESVQGNRQAAQVQDSLEHARDPTESRRDSREFGPLPTGLVKGVVLGVIWPLSRTQWLNK
ncbi:peptidase S24/S26A/S26B/S26C [Gorgonomyces haynaldii]|nr:peptidase S24/S26A/S26B/S26C [Gorgonomyces haynaldii]